MNDRELLAAFIARAELTCAARGGHDWQPVPAPAAPELGTHRCSVCGKRKAEAAQ